MHTQVTPSSISFDASKRKSLSECCTENNIITFLKKKFPDEQSKIRLSPSGKYCFEIESPETDPIVRSVQIFLDTLVENILNHPSIYSPKMLEHAYRIASEEVDKH